VVEGIFLKIGKRGEKEEKRKRARLSGETGWLLNSPLRL
jgi:hypothetical protein